jgi:hypothetical protein
MNAAAAAKGPAARLDRFPGHGDVDHVAVAPTGVAFAIETRPAASTTGTSTWSAPRPRGYSAAGARWCPHGARAVVCVTRGQRLEQVQDEVLVVSVDRLAATLRRGARCKR